MVADLEKVATVLQTSATSSKRAPTAAVESAHGSPRHVHILLVAILIVIGLIGGLWLLLGDRTPRSTTDTGSREVVAARSLAVLPFRDMTADSDRSWFRVVRSETCLIRGVRPLSQNWM
jgi:hypothetical protein